MAVGDPVVAFGTLRTLEANGASITAGSVVQADDAAYALSANNNWPDAEPVLTVQYSTAPTQGRAINLMARPLDIDGTNDAQVPEAGRPTLLIGSFTVDNVTTLQVIPLNSLIARDLPRDASYYLHNDTDQTVPSGWKLTMQPRNTVPATS